MSSLMKFILFGLIYGVITFLLSPAYDKLVSNNGFWNVKEQLLYLSGSIAMAYMVLSMVLSSRFTFVNKLVGGLDKGYVIHKWIGVLAMSFAIFHWLIEQSPRIALYFNLIAPRAKSNTQNTEVDLGKQLYSLGNDIVEIAFYILILIVIISLIKKIPYHIFKVIHKTIPIFFIMVTIHTATIQIKGGWYFGISSLLLWIMMIVGLISAFLSLFFLIGKKNKVLSKVTDIKRDEKHKIIEVTLSVDSDNFDYKAGQYAFLSFPFKYGAHPFSIGSFNKNKKEITFYIKELGDYTNILYENTKVGDNVIIEGAYGEFTFNKENLNQIWISGGIGISPFLSIIDYLSNYNSGDYSNIYFFCSMRGDNPYKEKILQLCNKLKINVFFIDTSKEKRLTFDDVKEKVKDVNGYDLLYCGPTKMIKEIKNIIKKYNLSVKVHFDNFEMR